MGIYDSPELSTKAKTPKKPTPSKKMKPCKECGKPVMTFTKKCPFCNCMKPGLPAYLVPINAITSSISSLLSTELGGGGGDKTEDKPIPLETLQREYYEGLKADAAGE